MKNNSEYNELSFLEIIRTLNSTQIIMLYQEAYYYDYASDAIYDTDKEFDEVFSVEYPLEIVKLYCLNSNHFDPYEDYFMYNEHIEELKSYSVNELAKLILSDYRGCLENFYNENREKFLKVLDND